MKTCVLCLEINAEYNNYISIQSPEWSKLQILNIIEQHFWPIENLQHVVGICQTCWSHLYDFHIFYTNVEDAHRKNINFSLEGKPSRKQTVPLVPRILKTESTSTEESIFIIDKNCQDIKTEKNLCVDKPKFCVPENMGGNELGCITTAKVKNKRGRPRKIRDINELLTKKPKGKRGRPRKYVLEKNDINTNNPCFFRNGTSITYTNNVISNKHSSATDPLSLRNNSSDTETLQTSVVLQNRKRGRPPKIKRQRGRPRKVQINETANCIPECNKAATSADNPVLKTESHIVHAEELSKEFSLNLNDKDKQNKKDLIFKKQNIVSILKKRKRMQQHKALMRNYIATSMRCMKFVKK